jgi:hypothetical protein
VSADAFVGRTSHVAVVAGRETREEVELQPGIAVEGRVVDDETGAALEGASVVVHAGGSTADFGALAFGPPYGRTRTDANGRFRVATLPREAVATVAAEVAGRTREGVTVRAVDGVVRPSPVEIRLAPAGRIVGVVRGDDGGPLARAQVFVYRAADAQLFRRDPRSRRTFADGRQLSAIRADTAEDGSFAVGGLALGVEHVAVAEASGFLRSPEKTGLVALRESTDVRTEISLEPAAEVVLRLVDRKGRPVAATMALVRVGSSSEIEETTDDGTLVLESLDAGEHEIGLDVPGFLRATETVRVERGGRASRTVALDPGAEVRGVAVDEKGEPLPFASVSVAPASSNDSSSETESLKDERSSTAGPDGAFAVGGLPPGDCVLVASWYRPDAVARKTRERLPVVAPSSGVRVVLAAQASVSMRLLAPDGKPYAGHVNRWWGRTELEMAVGTIVPDGRVVWDQLADGEYRLEARTGRYATVRRTVTLRPSEALDLGDVRLSEGVEISGRVVAPDGTPVVGASVSAADQTASTDERGTFRLPRLDPGPWTLFAEAAGRARAEVEVHAGAGSAPVEVVLPRGALVRGRVLDARGEPPPGGSPILALPAGTSPNHPAGVPWTDDRGRFELRMPPGRWRFALVGSKGGEVPLDGEWTFVEGETRDLVLRPATR